MSKITEVLICLFVGCLIVLAADYFNDKHRLFQMSKQEQKQEKIVDVQLIKDSIASVSDSLLRFRKDSMDKIYHKKDSIQRNINYNLNEEFTRFRAVTAGLHRLDTTTIR